MLGVRAYLRVLKVADDVAHKQGSRLLVDVLHLFQDGHVINTTTVRVKEASQKGINESKVWLFAVWEGSSCHAQTYETVVTPPQYRARA